LKRIEQELILSSGYVKTASGNWKAKSEIFDEAYESLKKHKEISLKEQRQKILRSHKVFGIHVEPEKGD